MQQAIVNTGNEIDPGYPKILDRPTMRSKHTGDAIYHINLIVTNGFLSLKNRYSRGIDLKSRPSFKRHMRNLKNLDFGCGKYLQGYVRTMLSKLTICY